MNKMIVVEILKEIQTNHYEMAGRCLFNDIIKGDYMSVDQQADSLVLVYKINVYNKYVDVLHHGYVGTLWIEVISGRSPVLGDRLVPNITSI